MRRSYLVTLAVLCCAGIAYATGSITVTGYPAVPRTLKGGPGISIGADGTFTATGDAIVTGAQPFENLSAALRGKYLGANGTATNASAYKGNSAPNATEFSYLQGVTGAIQTQLNGKADTSSLSLVATTGQYSNLSGKPALSAVATSGAYSDLTGKPTLSTVATSGDYADLANKPTLSTVAGTGSYTDLANKPVIPAAQVNSDWNATTGVTKINNKPTLATVATSGNYSDLNGKPVAYTLPTATTTVLGGVKIDGNSIQIDGAGVIHSTVAAGVSSVNGYTGIIDLQTTDITGFGNYSASTNAKLAAKMDNVNPAFTGTLSTTNADGTWRMNVRNSVSRSYPPQEGDMDTDAAGKLWLYVSGAWVEKGATYTLPPAGPNQLGGVKTGSTLTIANGVLDVMVSSLGPSGLVTAGLSGDATIRKGFAYVAASTGKWTFANYSSGTTTIFSNYTGTVCAATSGGLNITNPITFANRTSSCAKVYAGTYATIQSRGDGKYWVTSNRNLTKQTGAASGTGGGGGGATGALASDNFNRADQSPLRDGANTSTTPTGTWGSSPGFDSVLKLASNMMSPATPFITEAASYSSAASWTNDQWSECTIPAGSDVGPAVRLATSGTARQGYMLSVNSSTSMRIVKWSPSPTVVTGSSQTISTTQASDVWKISVIGSSIYAYRNGSLISGYPVTDTSIASGSPGVAIRNSAGIVDNWAGGNN